MSASVKTAYFMLVISMVIWGGTPVAAKVVASEMLPFTASFWRFVLAALALLPLVWLKEGRVWPKNLSPLGWLVLFILGATGMLSYSYFFVKGLALIEAGRTAVIVALNPTLTFLGSVIFFREKFTKAAPIGLIGSFFGALIVVSNGRFGQVLAGELGLGELYIFACPLSWAIYALLGKYILARLTPLMATTWATLTGVILLLGPALAETGGLAWPDLSVPGWTAMAFWSVLGASVGFTLYYEGVLTLGARRSSIFMNLVPVFGVAFAALVLGENLDWPLLAGLVLIVAGIRLTQN